MRKVFFLFVMLGTVIPHLYSQSLYSGKFWELGGSYSWASYTDEIDDLMNIIDKRTTFTVEFSFGSALTRKFYLAGTGYCLVDLFSHSRSSLTIFLPFIGFGVRYYPFNKWLQLGMDTGLTWMTVNANINNTKTSDTNFGPGIKASIAIDFDIGLLFGFNYSISLIDSEFPRNWGVFIKMLNKY